MLPFIQRVVVEDRKWLSEDEMVNCIVMAQSLPGVLAINTATYVGKKKAGFPGAIAASLGVILPSFIVIILLVLLLDKLGISNRLNGAFTGVKAAAAGLILFSALKLGKQAVKGWFGWTLAVGSFILVSVFNVSVVWIIILGALIGVTYMVLLNRKKVEE